MSHWECNACPFTTTDEDAARAHHWVPEPGILHRLSLIVEPEEPGNYMTNPTNPAPAAVRRAKANR